MICTNKSCKWRKDGKCILFVGVRVLECKYRQTIEAKPKKQTLAKKGN
jgi:hypothetical protein